MGAGEQAQDQPIRLCSFRIGSTQLRRHAIRHGRIENRPVLRRQQSEIRADQRNAGEQLPPFLW